MIVAVHALLGAALARHCRTKIQAFLLGGLSHLAADLVPHRDLKVAEEAVLVAGALGLVGVVRGPDSREFAGAVGAALPDLENLVGRVLRIPDRRRLLPTHSKYHGWETKDCRSQVGLALLCLATLCRRPDRCESGAKRGNSSR